MRIFERSFHRVKMVLSSDDSMKKLNQFVGDRIFTEEGDLFDCMEDNRSFEDGGIERVNSM